MRVQRALAASAVVVVAGLALTACQDDVTVSASTGGGQTASAPSTAKTSGGTGASSGTTGSSTGGTGAKTPSSGSAGSKAPAGGASGSGTAATAACTTANLIPDVSVGSPTPSAEGNLSVTVSLANKGDACTLYGFAGVDLAMGSETNAVPRGFKQPGTVTLAKGEDSMFTIWYRPSPKGHPGTKVTTMTITPPGETHSVKLNWPGQELAAGADANGTDTLFLDPVAKH
ncbi:DUF4232 domain-containing protein [Kitasatospora kifunensis]|uniref:DUF4232 domain-containing protein n=1 Tax=Kitasatospora kifunensis TaxID=58351 RepID=A0A7W7QXU8_KITKI|nr:DUF4232 domain-containing protein [Kitasatospora kifunensis]MBB4921518.1 hypothetical protein [Kitasatospora kifunensis]